MGPDVEGANGTNPSPNVKAELGDKSRPSAPKSCLLRFCRTINLVAGSAALLCLVAHVMALSIPTVDAVTEVHSTSSHTQLQILRLYSVGTALLCVIIETESEWVLAWFRAAEQWVGRGLLQGFLGVLTLQLASSTGDSDFDKSLGIYRQVAGYAMIGCAAIYFSGGLLCVGVLKKAYYNKAMERMRVERDIEVLDRQREELRSMLNTYTK